MAACARQLPPSRRALGCRRAGSPARRVRTARHSRRRAGHPAQHRRGRCGAGLVRRYRQVPGPARPGGPGRAGIQRHRRWRGPPGGGPGPARDEAVNQVSARCAGPVTCLPPARPRPTAMCQPVAVVRMAGMTIVVAGSAACPALPWQASIERRIAGSARLTTEGSHAGGGAQMTRFCGDRPWR